MDFLVIVIKMQFSSWSLGKGLQYKEAKSEVDPSYLDYVTEYMLWREVHDEWPDDDQSPGMYSVYKDTNMMFFHSMLLPRMEAVTGLNLLPTYTYTRVYRPGAILEKHKDRPACEVSATMLVGANYSPTWPLYIEGESIIQQPGDMAVYRGCEVEHWRDPMVDAPEDAYHVQLFLHYVDADGPYHMCQHDEIRL